MTRRASARAIGAFVVGAVILVVGGVIIFSSGLFFRQTVEFVSFFDGSVAGLNVGAPVKFRGVEVGSVRAVLLDIPGAERPSTDFRIPVIFELDERRIRARGSQANLEDPTIIDSLIGLGMRARLEVESFVTGRKFIGLDVHPDSPINLVRDPGVPFREIPTLSATGLEELEAELGDVVARIGEADIAGLVTSLKGFVDGLDETVNSRSVREATESLPATVRNINETLVSIRDVLAEVDSSVAPLRESTRATSDEARIALQEAQATLATMRTVMEPGSPITYRITQAMADFAAAARALRALAEELERNPSAIVRGKEGPN